MRNENDILSSHKIIVREVCYISGNLTCFNGSSKIHIVDKLISGEVEKYGAFLHGLEQSAVKHSLG